MIDRSISLPIFFDFPYFFDNLFDFTIFSEYGLGHAWTNIRFPAKARPRSGGPGHFFFRNFASSALEASGRRRRRRGSSRVKKRRILFAAQEMFGQYGYHATTVKMIAEKAHVAFGLVAHHFGDKENLFLSAGFNMVDQVMQAISEHPGKARDGLEDVGLFIQAYLDFTLDNQTTFPILIRCSPFADVDLDFARERIAVKFGEFLTEISRRLDRGMRDGSIREAPLMDTAILVYGGIISAVRARFLTPYRAPGLYREAKRYAIEAIRSRNGNGTSDGVSGSVFDASGMID